jgi:chemotaxis protein MotB
MKQTKLMVMAMMAVALMATSCASKKDLQNCQNENKELSSNYQATKEKLAATEASLAAAQEQLATAKSDYAKLQNSLDKSLNNASQNNVSIEKLVDQINESNQYIRHLVEVKSKSDSLNMVLTNNLTNQKLVSNGDNLYIHNTIIYKTTLENGAASIAQKSLSMYL